MNKHLPYRINICPIDVRGNKKNRILMLLRMTTKQTDERANCID